MLAWRRAMYVRLHSRVLW